MPIRMTFRKDQVAENFRTFPDLLVSAKADLEMVLLTHTEPVEPIAPQVLIDHRFLGCTWLITARPLSDGQVEAIRKILEGA